MKPSPHVKPIASAQRAGVSYVLTKDSQNGYVPQDARFLNPFPTRKRLLDRTIHSDRLSARYDSRNRAVDTGAAVAVQVARDRRLDETFLRASTEQKKAARWIGPQSRNALSIGNDSERTASLAGANGQAGAVQGVSEITFGMAGPFTGAAKELGRQMKLGIETAFNLANEAGGISSRQVKLTAADERV